MLMCFLKGNTKYEHYRTPSEIYSTCSQQTIKYSFSYNTEQNEQSFLWRIFTTMLFNEINAYVQQQQRKNLNELLPKNLR